MFGSRWDGRALELCVLNPSGMYGREDDLCILADGEPSWPPPALRPAFSLAGGTNPAASKPLGRASA